MPSADDSSEGLYPVAILAGGIASRLRPHTDTIPKSLLDVHGQPFLAYQLRLLASRGIRHVVICAGYLGTMIQEFVGSGEDFGLAVSFSFDGPKLLGTGGAIKKALPLLGPAFFVLYGDSYLPCDYKTVQCEFEKRGKKGLMTVYQNNNLHDESNVEFRDGIIYAYDKAAHTDTMRHIDYGLGVFRASAFEVVSSDEAVDLSVVYQTLLKLTELAAFEVSTRFYEIGSVRGLAEFRDKIARRALG
jgi:N-acetyl-alpha-D-muramate 1-phosphate uridylyltransferase